MYDKFAKIVANMGLVPKQEKICQHDKAVVKLESIGKHTYRVTLTVTDIDLADERKDGGVCVTFWESPWMAEKMYDHHLAWIKSLPEGSRHV